MSIKVLVVEDEIKLAELLRDYLQQASMDVRLVMDGDKVMEAIHDFSPDIMLLDIMLPNKDGLTICREVRENNHWKQLAIIMTTARVDEIDRLLGLEIGADDYVCKPYSPREIVARVKTIMRRLQGVDNISIPGLVFYNDKMKALWNGFDLELTAVEYALLKLMSESPGKIFSRQSLMDNIYQDYRVVSERTIDSHIKKLRQRILTHDENAQLIHSVYGVGYKVELS